MWGLRGGVANVTAIVHRGKAGVVLGPTPVGVVHRALIVRACEGNGAVVHVVAGCTAHRVPLGFYA